MELWTGMWFIARNEAIPFSWSIIYLLIVMGTEYNSALTIVDIRAIGNTDLHFCYLFWGRKLGIYKLVLKRNFVELWTVRKCCLLGAVRMAFFQEPIFLLSAVSTLKSVGCRFHQGYWFRFVFIITKKKNAVEYFNILIYCLAELHFVPTPIDTQTNLQNYF